ncbi:MAG: hypothetical protein SVZ03_05410 [Spirochaetota bacterium]|nr:hypothetical protein [Spirochaetota bacterium]
MKKGILLFLFSLIILSILGTTHAYPQKKIFSLIEEDRSFWNELLDDNTINNKNLLYASYIAYKDRLNDLSIETFQECINSNSTNSIINGIANYYIGKNLFLIGKYREAITRFSYVNNINLAKFNYIKFAALLNIAITYYQLNDIEKCRENIQKVISGDIDGKYKRIALDILSQL